jgi:hypothetical protein
MNLVDRRHCPQPGFFEGRANHERVPILEEKDRRQPLAAMEVDSRQVEQIRGRSREETVGLIASRRLRADSRRPR